ncbi:MAG: hypothetical protein A2033_16050 [Bacteroidetes bacterium GWA2_31_9]|nr:MAG: hypothetical protein A2033_16050 [Bacteroidetes bacterium GWA2_31_9]
MNDQNENTLLISFDDERDTMNDDIVIYIRDKNLREVGLILKDDHGITIYQIYDYVGALLGTTVDMEQAKLIARVQAKNMIDTRDNEHRNSKLEELRFLQAYHQKRNKEQNLSL